MRRTTLLILLMAVAMGLAATPARANIIVANEGGPITGGADPEAGFFRWYYRVSIEPDQLLRTGTSFTIYDFDGFMGGAMATGTTTGASWSFSATPVGVLVGQPDDPAEFNLNWTYTGPDFSDPATETTIGTFSALSAYDLDSAVEGYFAGEAFHLAGPNVYAPMLNLSGLGDILVPEEPVGAEVVPEPASMILLGTGLAATLARRRRQRQS